MTKKLFFSAALALTLAGGAVAAATSAPVVAVAPAAAQAVSAPIAAAAVAQDAAAVQLTAAQMATVQGAGIFSFFKRVFRAVKRFIGGVIASIFRYLRDNWTVTVTVSGDDGGQEDEQEETVTENYNTQADYDAGNVSSTASETGAWVTTNSWGGGGGGGCAEREGGIYMMEIQEAEMSTC
jgi:hypothetical protein